ncbi:soma ferritin-like [Symsagittifera roscoffensis]|uniref:soma ferritin-like n=1 Tax=Symsagittifera roscoffensis TaxID=84072 RepID=UPI00307C61FF
MSSKSQCRQNFHEECEAGVNKQINMELTASYVYHSLALYCDRDDVALPNLHKFFLKNSEEEREHAEKLMKYQNKRGGRIVLQDIKKPEATEYGSIVDMLSLALQLERDVNQSLLDMHGLAEKNGDPQFTDFVEGEFLKEQVDAIKELGSLLSRAKRCGSGLGEFQFDDEALG